MESVQRKNLRIGRKKHNPPHPAAAPTTIVAKKALAAYLAAES